MLAWGALQSGAWGSPAQPSGTAALEAGFQPHVHGPLHPWFRGGYYYGSGDGMLRTAFTALSSRFYPLLAFTHAIPFSTMDNRDAFGEMILRPSKSVTVRIDGHHLSLASANDLWYTGGGAFQPGTFGYQGRPSNGKTDLANLDDASLDYAFNRAVLSAVSESLALGIWTAAISRRRI